MKKLVDNCTLAGSVTPDGQAYLPFIACVRGRFQLTVARCFMASVHPFSFSLSFWFGLMPVADINCNPTSKSHMISPFCIQKMSAQAEIEFNSRPRKHHFIQLYCLHASAYRTKKESQFLLTMDHHPIQSLLCSIHPSTFLPLIV